MENSWRSVNCTRWIQNVTWLYVVFTVVFSPQAVDSTDYISNLGQSLGFNVNISVKGIYRYVRLLHLYKKKEKKHFAVKRSILPFEVDQNSDFDQPKDGRHWPFLFINFIFCPSDCKDNKPLWTTLQLHEVINLDEIMNVSQVRRFPLGHRTLNASQLQRSRGNLWRSEGCIYSFLMFSSTVRRTSAAAVWQYTHQLVLSHSPRAGCWPAAQRFQHQGQEFQLHWHHTPGS